MKRILFILPLLLAVATFTSCAGDDYEMPVSSAPASGVFSFKGCLRAGDYEMPEAEVVVELNQKAVGYADIKMSGVKFSDKMPMALDITLSNVPCTETDGKLLFSGENIVPLIAGKANSDYRFALLSGWINADASEITFVAQMADDLAAHVAGMVFVYTAGKAGNDGGDVVVPPTTEGIEYAFTGSLLVGDYAMTGAALTVVVNRTAGTVDVKMLGVKFSDRMPLVLDITLCGLACENVGGVMRFAGQNVVPLIGAEPSANYTFASVIGEFDVKSSTLSFSAQMADNLEAFVAGKEFMYNGQLNK